MNTRLPRRLEGLGCLIVGGTSGIGLAAARRFLQEGARVMVAGHSAHNGAIARESLEALGSVSEHEVDVVIEHDLAQLFEHTLKFLGGRVDVLLHSAGMSGRKYGDGPLADCSREGWDRVLEVNVTGTFLTNRLALRRMLEQSRDARGSRGSIINVGSVVDRAPSLRFDTIAYAASKAAVRALTIASACRYAKDGIRFNLIEPGLVDTPMAARAVQDAELTTFRASKQPLTGGAVRADDVAEAAVFLASPESRAMTGATITVDGGWRVSEGQETPR